MSLMSIISLVFKAGIALLLFTMAAAATFMVVGIAIRMVRYFIDEHRRK